VRERTLAVAVTERPDARNVGAQLIVDLDVAAFVDGNAGFLQPEFVRVGATADRQQQM